MTRASTVLQSILRDTGCAGEVGGGLKAFLLSTAGVSGSVDGALRVIDVDEGAILYFRRLDPKQAVVAVRAQPGTKQVCARPNEDSPAQRACSRWIISVWHPTYACVDAAASRIGWWLLVSGRRRRQLYQLLLQV